MTGKLLTSTEAAQRLGISTCRLYEWLTLSDRGDFVLRGVPITINYFQSGARGQGRIKIAAEEVERLLAQMRVRPAHRRRRRSRVQQPILQHITAKLGRPDD